MSLRHASVSEGSVDSAIADADMCLVRNDWPAGCDLTAADFSDMCRKVVVDGRRILQGGAMAGVDLVVVSGRAAPAEPL